MNEDPAPSNLPADHDLFDLEHANAPHARQRARDYGLEAAMLTQARALSALAGVDERFGLAPRAVAVEAYAIDEDQGVVTYLYYAADKPVQEDADWFCTDAWFDPERPEGRKAALEWIAKNHPPKLP